mgnify:CR=1 FL=1
MKVIFNYEVKEGKPTLNMKCEDLPNVDDSNVIDQVKYYLCLKAIHKTVEELLKCEK